LENLREDLRGELNLVSRCCMKVVSSFIKFFSNTEFRLYRFSCVTCCKSVKPKFHITERPRHSDDKNVINFLPQEHWRGLHDIQCARMYHSLLCCVCNKRAYVVRRNIVHRIYQSVPYFLNIVRFYDTHVNVIAFTSIRKVWTS
jgi:hypothetical protein